MKLVKYLDEASSSQAVPRFHELHDILMGSNPVEKLQTAPMKIQKEAAKIFQQAISLLKGLK